MKKTILVIILFLAIIMICGCVEKQTNVTMETDEIINHVPKTSFTYTNDIYTVTFVDKSTDEDNDSLTYIWDFGDGTTSTEQNPIHIYDCSETNVFDITLTINDGELNDTATDRVLFTSHLNILNYSQNWIGYDSYEEKGFYEPVWVGYISMTIENTGNIPAEICYARIDSKEQKNNYPVFSTEIYFNFTYTYDELVEEGGNGFESAIWVTVISNNTLKLNPNESIILTSNPDLAYIIWGTGNYPVNIWVFEKSREKIRSYTLYETVIYLS